MVKARYRNSEEDYRYFTRYTAFVSNGRLARILMFFGCALVMLIVAFFTAQGVFLICSAVFAAFGALLTVLAFAAVNRNVKRTLKEAKDFAAVENVYTFYEDKFVVENKVKGRIKEKEVFYGNIYKAVESGRFFFLYVNSALAFIVSKTDIEEGSADELRGILCAAIGEKRCRIK